MINEEGVKKYLEILGKPYFWRLFVDGVRQLKTTEFSEEFQGYNEAQLGHFFWSRREPNGLNRLKLTTQKLFSSDIEKSLTFDFIASVHNSAYPFSDYLRLTTGYLTTGVHIFGDFVNEKQILWICNRAKQIKNDFKLNNEPWHIEKYGKGTMLPYEIVSNLPYAEKLSIYNKLLNKYNNDIISAESNESKLPIIAQFMQDLECLHFFTDGNCRMVYLLLNKELIKNGLDPVLLHNPNYFDTFLINDLVAEIQKGQIAFNNLYENGIFDESCIPNEEIVNNLAILGSDNFALRGGDGFTYEEAVNYSETSLQIFDYLSSGIKDNKQLIFNISDYLMIFDYAKNKFPEHAQGKTFHDFANSKKGKIIINIALTMGKQNLDELIKNVGENTNSFIELLNSDVINDFIEQNVTKFPKLSRIDLIKKYIEELKDLAQIYVDGYSAESLLNPETCHLTIPEAKAFETNNFIDIDQFNLLDIYDNETNLVETLPMGEESDHII